MQISKTTTYVAISVCGLFSELDYIDSTFSCFPLAYCFPFAFWAFYELKAMRWYHEWYEDIW